MIKQQQAIDQVLKQKFDWGTESIPLEQCFGRVLAQDVIADRPQPPFDRVTMDGICIDYQAYAAGQRLFPVSHLQAAGDAPAPLKDPRRCIEIMTGAALPPGVSTVIRYEDLETKDNAFLLPEGIQDQKNIHFSGSDLVADGQAIMAAGAEISTGAIGLLATFGLATSLVKKMPNVTIVSTGNELVAVDIQDPKAHQIRRSNVYQLAALLRARQIPVQTLHLPDDREEMSQSIGELLTRNDILIFSGGVSKGKLDFLPEVLHELGVEKLFHRVAQRPGKPLWVGRTEGTMVFGLPGNPVSSLACLLLYVGPFIRRNLGLPDRKLSLLPLSKDHHFGPDLSLALTARRVQAGPDRELAAEPVIGQGSGDATSLLRTDGFLLLPRGREQFAAGDRFPFLALNELY